MKRGIRILEMGTWLAAGGVLVATFAWPPSHLRSQETETRALAEAALARVADSERGAFKALGHYVSFGPSVQERQTAFPQLQLAPETDAFELDALATGAGIRLRVITKAEAIVDGRVLPLVITRDLSTPPVASGGTNDVGTQP